MENIIDVFCINLKWERENKNYWSSLCNGTCTAYIPVTKKNYADVIFIKDTADLGFFFLKLRTRREKQWKSM